MHTRHIVFGIGLPLTAIANGVLGNFATPEEITNSQTIAAFWIPLAAQLIAGIQDIIKGWTVQKHESSVKEEEEVNIIG